MKKLLILLCSLSCAHATLSTVSWSADTPDDFRLDLTGIGFPLKEDLVSPSGLWTLDVWENAYFNQFSPFVWFASGGTEAWSATGAHLFAGPWAANFSFPFLRVGGGQRWDRVIAPDWVGTNLVSVDSIPELSDNTTWRWSATYQAHRIPETGGITCLAIGLGIILLLRNKICLAEIVNRNK